LLKRVFSISMMVLMAVGAAGLMAFGPRPSGAVASDRLHIQYWEKWTGLEAQQCQQIVDAFNNGVGKEKGIYVDYVSISQIDRKTLVAIAAAAPPDVIGLWGSDVLEFAAKGALEPLDEYTRSAGLTRERYKPVFYDGCEYQGKLYALPSTAWSVALLWNKQVFADKADRLRAAGLDPTRPPRTLEELDRYAAALDTWETRNGGRHLAVAGCVPLEPGSFTSEYPFWFGAPMSNADGSRVLFDTPEMMACFDWIRGYSQRIGKNALAEFRSGFNAGSTSIFDTPQNPFLMGWIAMEQQGTWMAAFIEKLSPALNRWHVPAEQLEREKNFARITPGMSRDDVEHLLGTGNAIGPDQLQWPAGVKTLTINFADGKVASMQARLLPARDRQQYCEWGAAAWPSAVPGLDNVTYAGTDVWVIPSTAKHKQAAFEFMKFASRQDQLEKLALLHCNLSPLARQSEAYLENHPNPYVDVYEALAASPHARALPPLINWPQLQDELLQAAEASDMEVGTTRTIVAELQRRSQADLDKTLDAPDPGVAVSSGGAGTALLTPSPGTLGEDRGKGDLERPTPFDNPNHPHPDPLPDYRKKGPAEARLQ
jgi:ABC-type glycerol-3-phosphate transport system substrate-binding protein